MTVFKGDKRNILFPNKLILYKYFPKLHIGGYVAFKKIFMRIGKFRFRTVLLDMNNVKWHKGIS